MEYEFVYDGKKYVLCSDQTFRGELLQEPIVVYTQERNYFGLNSVRCHLYPNGTWKVIQIRYYEPCVKPFFMPFVEEILCLLPKFDRIPLYTSLRKVTWHYLMNRNLDNKLMTKEVRSALYQMKRYPHQIWIPYGSQQRLVTCWNKEIHRLQMLSVVYQITLFKNNTIKKWYTRIYQHLLLDATVHQENSHVLEKNE